MSGEGVEREDEVDRRWKHKYAWRLHSSVDGILNPGQLRWASSRWRKR